MVPKRGRKCQWISHSSDLDQNCRWTLCCTRDHIRSSPRHPKLSVSAVLQPISSHGHRTSKHLLQICAGPEMSTPDADIESIRSTLLPHPSRVSKNTADLAGHPFWRKEDDLDTPLPAGPSIRKNLIANRLQNLLPSTLAAAQFLSLQRLKAKTWKAELQLALAQLDIFEIFLSKGLQCKAKTAIRDTRDCCDPSQKSRDFSSGQLTTGAQSCPRCQGSPVWQHQHLLELSPWLFQRWNSCGITSRC